VVHDHRRVGRFRDGNAIDPRNPMELPDIATVALLDDLDA
jgi:hypothetical protein